MSREDEIRARVEKATLGPWWFDYKAYQMRSRDDVLVTEDIISPDDQNFIAHAREDVPYLLAENARLARQGEVLAMEFVRTHSREDVQNWENRYQYGDRSDYAIRMHNVFDALAGEGGGV